MVKACALLLSRRETVVSPFKLEGKPAMLLRISQSVVPTVNPPAVFSTEKQIFKAPNFVALLGKLQRNPMPWRLVFVPPAVSQLASKDRNTVPATYVLTVRKAAMVERTPSTSVRPLAVCRLKYPARITEFPPFGFPEELVVSSSI